jgi:hypothetical protein
MEKSENRVETHLWNALMEYIGQQGCDPKGCGRVLEMKGEAEALRLKGELLDFFAGDESLKEAFRRVEQSVQGFSIPLTHNFVMVFSSLRRPAITHNGHDDHGSPPIHGQGHGEIGIDGQVNGDRGHLH